MASPHHPNPNDRPAQRLFALLFGCLLGLGLLKWGNPVVMSHHVPTPSNAYEWVLTAWPLGAGCALLAVVALSAAGAVRTRGGVPRWLVLAPLPWLVWQCVAATGSVDATLTTRTLIHFLTNVVCFYLGVFCLSPITRLRWFWTALIAGFTLVLLSGWQQHFGGLESSREYFFNEVYPTMNGDVSEELLKRMSSNRIFATLFYPNTLAGVLLLLTPVSIGVFPEVFRHGSTRRIALMLTLVLAAGCLLWSGSKAGWLLALVLGLTALLRLRFSRTLKAGIAAAVLVGGCAGFVWKYAGYLEQGAQSAVARLDYWKAVLQVTTAHPLRGTGPGTFGKAYATVKRPESEMAQLSHNDYLQQASDSGIPGFVGFGGFVVASMTYLGRRVWHSPQSSMFWTWLGLLGITLQSLTEFGLYIPAVSWPTMALLGWLVGSTRNDLDKQKPANLTSHLK